ncbi:hypothetical protein MUK42_10282, partial [Musa troglodytarum]
ARRDEERLTFQEPVGEAKAGPEAADYGGLEMKLQRSLRMLYVPIEIKHDKLDIHKSSPKWTPHTQRWNIMAIVKCSISAHCFGAFQDESA